MTRIRSHKDLTVWQKSMDLVMLIYSITNEFPRSEKYGLISQMRRSSISIPSNIAEGQRRYSKNDFARFLNVAFSSGAELETQLEIACRLKYISKDVFERVEELLSQVMKMLNKMLKSLKRF